MVAGGTVIAHRPVGRKKLHPGSLFDRMSLNTRAAATVSGIQRIARKRQFENDRSPVSTIVKCVKRNSASEYSREFSARFNGQSRLIERGFRQGGPAGYGWSFCALHRLYLADSVANLLDHLGADIDSVSNGRAAIAPGCERRLIGDETDPHRLCYRNPVEGLRRRNIGQRSTVGHDQGDETHQELPAIRKR